MRIRIQVQKKVPRKEKTLGPGSVAEHYMEELG